MRKTTFLVIREPSATVVGHHFTAMSQMYRVRLHRRGTCKIAPIFDAFGRPNIWPTDENEVKFNNSQSYG